MTECRPETSLGSEREGTLPPHYLCRDVCLEEDTGPRVGDEQGDVGVSGSPLSPPVVPSLPRGTGVGGRHRGTEVSGTRK